MGEVGKEKQRKRCGPSLFKKVSYVNWTVRSAAPFLEMPLPTF